MLPHVLCSISLTDVQYTPVYSCCYICSHRNSFVCVYDWLIHFHCGPLSGGHFCGGRWHRWHHLRHRKISEGAEPQHPGALVGQSWWGGSPLGACHVGSSLEGAGGLLLSSLNKRTIAAHLRIDHTYSKHRGVGASTSSSTSCVDGHIVEPVGRSSTSWAVAGVGGVRVRCAVIGVVNNEWKVASNQIFALILSLSPSWRVCE